MYPSGFRPVTVRQNTDVSGCWTFGKYAACVDRWLEEKLRPVTFLVQNRIDDVCEQVSGSSLLHGSTILRWQGNGLPQVCVAGKQPWP